MTFALFGAFEASLDRALNTYVNGVSANISAGLGVIAAGGLTLYFMFMALSIARGEIEQPMSRMMKEAFGMLFICMVACGGGMYQSVVIDMAHALQGWLISKVTFTTATSIGELMDISILGSTVVVNGQEEPTATVLWKVAMIDPWLGFIPHLDYAFAALVVAASFDILVILCILPMLLAKVTTALMLAIGPFFVLMALWPATRNYFGSWLSALLGNILTMALVSMIASVAPSVLLENIKVVFAEVGQPTFNGVILSINIFVICVALGFISLHVSNMGAQLAGGGLAMDSKGLAGAVTQALLMRLMTPKPKDDDQAKSGGSASQASSGTAGSAGGAQAQQPQVAHQRAAQAANVVAGLLGRKK